MIKSKSKKIHNFKSVVELVEFFDSNDLGDYLEQMPEVHCKVDIKKKICLFALDAELANKITQLARSKKISSEKLINTWVREKVHTLSV